MLHEIKLFILGGEFNIIIIYIIYLTHMLYFIRLSTLYYVLYYISEAHIVLFYLTGIVTRCFDD